MDHTLCYRQNDLDVRELADTLDKDGSIVFPYSSDGQTLYTICLMDRFSVRGGVYNWGNPEGKTIVGILGFGTFWFDLRSDTELHPNYLIEKLNLRSDGDAQAVAALLNGIKMVLRSKK